MTTPSRVAHYSQRTPEQSAKLLADLKDPLRSRRLLIRGATVITMATGVGDLPTGDVMIEDGIITAVVPDVGPEAARDAVIIDAAGMIVAPGMVDSHRHCWQNSLRRLICDADLAEYMATTHGGAAMHFRPEDMYSGGLVSLYGALDLGVTCVLDFSHNSRSRAHSDAVFQSYLDTGIRAVHASAAPNVGEWERQWPEDLARLRDQYVTSDGCTTVRMGVDVHRVRPIEELIDYARSLDLAVTMDGVLGPASSGEIVALARAGRLGPDVSLIHCTSLTDDAWRAIADTGAGVTLAPTSDEQIGLGDGIPPVQRALDFGIRPSLSVDVEIALASDMFSQMRCVLSTQRMFATSLQYRGEEAPEFITCRDVFEFASVQGARANGLAPMVGYLAPGMQADLILVRADDINNLPLNNALGTLVLGTDSRNIDAVFVGGRVRKWDGQLVDVDLTRVRELAYASRDYLAEKAGFDISIVANPTRRQVQHELIQTYLDTHNRS